jgi:flagellar biogenesis protein FliO
MTETDMKEMTPEEKKASEQKKIVKLFGTIGGVIAFFGALFTAAHGSLLCVPLSLIVIIAFLVFKV